MKHSIIAAAAIAAAIALGGAGVASAQVYPYSPNVYTPHGTQNVQRVQLGTVLAVHAVRIQASSTAKGVGMAGGAAIGGILGNQVGGGTGKTLATIAGVIGGGLAGDKIVGHVRSVAGLQITVQLDKGESYGESRIIDVTQAATIPFAIGEKVQVIGGGYSQAARVEPLN